MGMGRMYTAGLMGKVATGVQVGGGSQVKGNNGEKGGVTAGQEKPEMTTLIRTKMT